MGRNKKQLNTPVVFIIFNRPDTAQKVFDEIKKIKPKKLFVISDGPRKSSEEKLCIETRKIIDDVDWDCKVFKNYSNKNLGLKERISSGLNWVFDNVEEAIILEDDCVPNPSFFRFCEEMLEKYRKNENIMMIGGSNPLKDFEMENSYTFSKYYQIWGWATWKRSWNKYDINMKEWKSTKVNKKIKEVYKQKYIINHVKKLFNNVSSGKSNTWDIQWLYACLINDGLSITPRVNLISNIGIFGTHQGGYNQNLSTYNIYDNGLTYPKIISQNENYDNTFYEKNFLPKPFNLKRWIFSVLVKYKNIKKTYHFLKKGFLKIHNILFITPKIIQIFINKTTNKLFGVVHIPTNGKPKGYVLLSYITDPFILTTKEYPTNPHTNYWECLEIARLFSIRGYAIDVIDANNTNFKPHRQYKVVIDIKNNLKILLPMLPGSCKKVMHITSSFGKYQNTQERKRIEELKKRRSVSFVMQRHETESDNPIYADFLEGFGNKTVHNTFSQFNKPIHFIPISVTQKFEFPKQKNFTEARTHFLFFGGGGAILKGLDLVIEAFSTLPNLYLHIIGPASYEKEFSEEYEKELALSNIYRYQKPKISKDGIIFVGKKPFIEIANQCASIIYPSASEGTSGAVIQSMHAGIIPIITKETGLSEDSPSIIIENPSVESIVSLAQNISKTDPEVLYKLAYDSWKFVNKHHTKEKFSEAYADLIDNILKL